MKLVSIYFKIQCRRFLFVDPPELLGPLDFPSDLEPSESLLIWIHHQNLLQFWIHQNQGLN